MPFQRPFAHLAICHHQSLRRSVLTSTPQPHSRSPSLQHLQQTAHGAPSFPITADSHSSPSPNQLPPSYIPATTLMNRTMSENQPRTSPHPPSPLSEHPVHPVQPTSPMNSVSPVSSVRPRYPSRYRKVTIRRMWWATFPRSSKDQSPAHRPQSPRGQSPPSRAPRWRHKSGEKRSSPSCRTTIP